MPAALRHIAVHVEEPRPQDFRWVLTEQEGDAWRPIGKATAADATYKEAMSAGLLALQALVDDLDAGPRRATTDASEATPRQQSAAPDEPPARSGFFGFGPAI